MTSWPTPAPAASAIPLRRLAERMARHTRIDPLAGIAAVQPRGEQSHLGQHAPLHRATNNEHARAEHREWNAQHQEDAPVIPHGCVRDLGFGRADGLFAVGTSSYLAHAASPQHEGQRDAEVKSAHSSIRHGKILPSSIPVIRVYLSPKTDRSSIAESDTTGGPGSQKRPGSRSNPRIASEPEPFRSLKGRPCRGAGTGRTSRGKAAMSEAL